MAKKVSVDNLANEIAKTMKEYQGATEEVVDKAISDTAKDALEKLKNANPSGSGQYSDWKSYNKGWKIMQTKTDKRYHKKATIHNSTKYRLTHLLEKGHALVGGGRTRAFPHIAPVAEKAEEELMDNIKRGINNA